MREIKEDFNKWRDISCPQNGRVNIVKILIILKLIYRFNAIPLKILLRYFVYVMLILKFMWQSIGPRMATIILEKRSKLEGSLYLT